MIRVKKSVVGELQVVVVAAVVVKLGVLLVLELELVEVQEVLLKPEVVF